MPTTFTFNGSQYQLRFRHKHYKRTPDKTGQLQLPRLHGRQVQGVTTCYLYKFWGQASYFPKGYKQLISKGRAVCSAFDEFNYSEGAELAYLRAVTPATSRIFTFSPAFLTAVESAYQRFITEKKASQRKRKTMSINQQSQITDALKGLFTDEEIHDLLYGKINAENDSRGRKQQPLSPSEAKTLLEIVQKQLIPVSDLPDAISQLLANFEVKDPAVARILRTMVFNTDGSIDQEIGASELLLAAAIVQTSSDVRAVTLANSTFENSPFSEVYN